MMSLLDASNEGAAGQRDVQRTQLISKADELLTPQYRVHLSPEASSRDVDGRIDPVAVVDVLGSRGLAATGLHDKVFAVRYADAKFERVFHEVPRRWGRHLERR
jgi:hypothetical protein